MGEKLVWMGRTETHAFRTYNDGTSLRVALCGALPDPRDQPRDRRAGRVCLSCRVRRRDWKKAHEG